MTLFSKATNRQAYLKMGLMGFAGDGKTYTATKVAIGLVNYMREHGVNGCDKPAYFLDTETGADWVMPMFEAEGIELAVAKTRTFTDLVPAIEEAEKNGSILIIDSITHFWRELTESYARRKNRTKGLQFQDWAWLKEQWGHFTDQFVNSRCHIIMCGRAGYEYDFFEQEGGKKELEKTGVKMKAETETGYEPSILVLMEKHRDMESNRVWRTAAVLKDRAALIDGQTFVNPTFEDFRPHIEYLNLGGEHVGVDTSKTSEGLVPSGAKPQWQYDKEQKEIALDEITEKLKEHYPSQGKEDKQARGDLLQKVFGTRAWSRVTSLKRDQVEAGRNTIWIQLDGAPYAFEPPEPEIEELEDDEDIPYD
jgi:hypothetical protein